MAAKKMVALNRHFEKIESGTYIIRNMRGHYYMGNRRFDSRKEGVMEYSDVGSRTELERLRFFGFAVSAELLK